jgi:hypothetical protein
VVRRYRSFRRDSLEFSGNGNKLTGQSRGALRREEQARRHFPLLLIPEVERMRFIVIAICAVVLFFPMYWLFEAVVGPDWGAGIAAVAMYIAFPVMALKAWPGRVLQGPQSMEAALVNGTLKCADFDVIEVA